MGLQKKMDEQTTEENDSQDLDTSSTGASPVTSINQDSPNEINRRKRKRRSQGAVYKDGYCGADINGHPFCTKCGFDFPEYNKKNGTTQLNRHVEDCFNLKLNLPKNLENVKSFSYEKQKELDELFLKIVINNSRSFSLGESFEFQQFIDGFGSDYKCMNGDKVHDEIIKKKGVSKTNVQKELNEVKDIAITLDCWEDVGGTHTLAVKGHYIDDDWKLQTRLLDVVGISTVKITGEIIHLKLSKIFEDFNIKDKVFFCTKDGGSIESSAVNSLNIPSHTCGQHKLNSILKNTIKKYTNINDLIRKVSLVSFIFRKGKPWRQFKKLQEERKLQPLKLIRSVKTRFNYSFYMIKRLVQLKEVVIELTEDWESLCSASKIKPPMFSEDDWKLLEDILAILEQFETAILILSCEFNPMVSAFPETYFRLQEFLEEFTNKQNITNFGKEFAKELDGQLTEAGKKHSEIIDMSVLFDIRFKEMTIYDGIDQDYFQKKAFEEIKRLTKRITRIRTRKTQESKSRLSNFLKKRPKEINDTDTLENEWKKYLELKEEDINSCPLLWWKKNESIFPNIARAAKRFLSIQASSATIERLFSQVHSFNLEEEIEFNWKLCQQLLF